MKQLVEILRLPVSVVAARCRDAARNPGDEPDRQAQDQKTTVRRGGYGAKGCPHADQGRVRRMDLDRNARRLIEPQCKEALRTTFMSSLGSPRALEDPDVLRVHRHELSGLLAVTVELDFDGIPSNRHILDASFGSGRAQRARAIQGQGRAAGSRNDAGQERGESSYERTPRSAPSCALRHSDPGGRMRVRTRLSRKSRSTSVSTRL